MVGLELPSNDRPADDAVKAIIDEWLVPALVEEYLRSNGLTAEQRRFADPILAVSPESSDTSRSADPHESNG